MKIKNIYIIFTFGILFGISCSDYLDIVPDNIPTVDHAFNTRYQALGFLYGCYSFLPDFAHPASNPAFLAADEAWIIEPIYSAFNPVVWAIAKGDQGTNSPVCNWWSSESDSYSLNGGKPLYTAIRDCNIFLDNIHKPEDIEEYERDQWIAEAKFLKAYYHFWLLCMYGPIPIITENLPISASSEDVQMYRQPVDSVFNYIVELLNEAGSGLPLHVESISLDMGRATRPIALALKAKVLTYAASPLFNGNADYSDFIDNRGGSLFSQTYEVDKWKKAVTALKEAIDICHEANIHLFDMSNTGIAANLSNETYMSMQVRGAMTERWNSEIIWGASNSASNFLQQWAYPAFNSNHMTLDLFFSFAPPLRMVEQFYTKNGVPIEEDNDWIDIDPYGLRVADDSHKYFIENGFETLNLHFDREPRFYGAITFDGGLYFGNGTNSDQNMWTTHFKSGFYAGKSLPLNHSSTGYLVKKVLHRLTSRPWAGGNTSYHAYSFPIIRLADLYLMYAEALNELKGSPDAEVYEYIDLVRNRTGLDGVIKSWSEHSVHPDKPTTKEGMREIIRRERLNELAFEGHRLWDLKRWKLSEIYMNQPIRGLNINGGETVTFYQETTIYPLKFEKKDYFWPIRTGNLLRNKNLVQNHGW